MILDLPVRGKWLARHAGASTLTNPHSNYRYAIDIMKIGPGAHLRKGKKDVSTTDYFSYNEPVYAPADGQVVHIVDGVEGDLIGNHIIINIGNEKYVFITHLKDESIPVEIGQFIKAGTLIGRVGNSGGASGILHLHMHVQNKAIFTRDATVTYPFRFRKMLRRRLLFWRKVSNGYLLRNDRFNHWQELP